MNKNNYDVYIFKENDRINLIFDRYKLIDVLTKLYERIGVVSRINTGYNISEKEKEIILSLIGESSNIQCSDKEKEDKTINVIYDIINATKVLNSLSSNLKTINVSDNKSNRQDKGHNNGFFELVRSTKTSSVIGQFNVHLTEQSSLTQYFNTLISDNNKTEINEIEDYASIDKEQEYCYLVNEVLKEFDEKQKKSYYVLYNIVHEAVLICEKDIRIAKCVEEFKEFKLIREYDDLMDTTFDKINEYFMKEVYCTEEMLIKKLDAFESLYDISKMCPLEKEKRLILYYINSNYHISNNIDKRIKVSVLQDDVQKELRINDTNLKYRFASILTELGLQKKRYSDGMYIYGIEPKSQMKVVNKEQIRYLSLNSIVEKRQKEIEEVKYTKQNITL